MHFSEKPSGNLEEQDLLLTGPGGPHSEVVGSRGGERERGEKKSVREEGREREEYLGGVCFY